MPLNPRSIEQVLSLLLPAHVEVLRELVELEARAYPGEPLGHDFLVVITNGGTFVMFGNAGHATIRSVSDLEALARVGAITLRETRRYSYSGAVQAAGYAIVADAGSEVERQVESRLNYIAGDEFRSRHARSYDAWRRAAARLDGRPDRLAVRNAGADCREAIQTFADDLARAYGLDADLPDIAKTKGRIKAVLAHLRNRLSESESGMLEALVGVLDANRALFDATQEAAQAGTHSGDNRTPDRTERQARRLLLLVLVTMAEIDAMLAEFAPI